MRKLILMTLLYGLVTSLVITAPAGAAPEIVGHAGPVNGSVYTVAPGDLLEISVWQNSDLSRQRPVLPDGTISLPLLGNIAVAGKGVEAIGHELAGRLDQYMHEPSVTVSVMKPDSMVIYVIGKVNHPGRFPMDGPVNVLQALAMAGGLNSFADADKIRIFRTSGDERQTFLFDYDEVSRDKQTQDNILLERGDTVVVR